MPSYVDISSRQHAGGKNGFIRFPLVYDKEIKIYENPYVLPRVFIVDQFKYAPTYEEAQKLIRRADFNLGEKVALEEPISKNLFTEKSVTTKLKSRAEIIEYQPNKVIIEVQTNQPGMLVLSDTYYPGWKAEIEGIPTKIYRVDGVIRGVFVNRGRHKVVFYYWPRSFAVGIGMAGVSALICILLIAIPTQSPKNN